MTLKKTMRQELDPSKPQEHEEAYWTEVIGPRSSWFDLQLKELWRYRDLVLLFIRRDFVTVYKQTILGPLWYLIQPLMTTFTFVIVFSNIAGISTDGQPALLFYMSGITIWEHFSRSLNRTSSTFIDNAHIFGKVYFPRLTVPVSVVVSSMITFGIQLGLFLLIYAFFYVSGTPLRPTLWLLALPVFLFLMALLGLGLGIIISSLTTKYRDLRFLVGFGVQLLMYASPVIYPLSALSPQYRFYVNLNPVSPVLEGFRYAFFGTGSFVWYDLIYTASVSVLIFLFGVMLFHRVERTFMDTV